MYVFRRLEVSFQLHVFFTTHITIGTFPMQKDKHCYYIFICGFRMPFQLLGEAVHGRVTSTHEVPASLVGIRRNTTTHFII